MLGDSEISPLAALLADRDRLRCDAAPAGAGPLLRYWSEQRHHLAGGPGAALAGRMFELRWIRRADRSRAVHLADSGRTGLRDTFGVILGS